MNDNKYIENDPERTLITLDQLSQTIEVMTSVVNRLRQHLSEQIRQQLAEQAAPEQEKSGSELAPKSTRNEAANTEQTGRPAAVVDQPRESVFVEINNPTGRRICSDKKVLH
ncbi:MAG: hypothetical protein ACR2PR_12355 [Pseudohongiellaceae bacterium]